jgi:hypothetical protein
MGSGVVVWLTRQAGQEGYPSLRLKNGFVQDDAEQTFEVWTQPAPHIIAAVIGMEKLRRDVNSF